MRRKLGEKGMEITGMSKSTEGWNGGAHAEICSLRFQENQVELKEWERESWWSRKYKSLESIMWCNKKLRSNPVGYGKPLHGIKERVGQ